MSVCVFAIVVQQWARSTRSIETKTVFSMLRTVARIHSDVVASHGSDDVLLLPLLKMVNIMSDCVIIKQWCRPRSNYCRALNCILYDTILYVQGCSEGRQAGTLSPLLF